MKNRLLCLLLPLTAVCGCTTTPKIDSKTNSSFEEINRLPLGASADVIKNTYGQPEIYDDGGSTESWLYFTQPKDGGVQKLAFGFDKKTKTLTGKLWISYDDNSLRDLSLVESKFPGARFIEYPILWCFGDSEPDDTRFVDSEKGITIIFRKTRQEVSDIIWSQPGIKYPTTCTKEDLQKAAEERAYWMSKLQKVPTSSKSN